MEALERLKRGKEGYLCHVCDTKRETSLEQTPIVCKYLDVFHKELPGLPSPRIIDFHDLIPDATPISKTPYRFAPVEMAELRKKLD